MTGGRGDCAIDAVGMEAERSFLDKVKAVVNIEKGTSKVLKLCFDAVRRERLKKKRLSRTFVTASFFT
jgi:alcohol dehydrogenase